MQQELCQRNVTDAVCPRRRLNPRRWALAGIGLCCVVIGAIGVVVPGLPTTVFLIMASWCFTKSCPVLERWLKEQPIFRPYTKYLDPSTPMPPRVRLAIIAVMWIAVCSSGFIFWTRDLLPFAAIPLAVAGLFATVCISRYRRDLPATR